MFFLNKKFYKDTTPIGTIHNRGLMLGDGFFTTLKIKNKSPVFLELHLERLQNFCRITSMDFPVYLQINYVQQIIETLCYKNNLIDGSLRISFFRTSPIRQIRIPENSSVDCLITLSPLPSKPVSDLKIFIPAAKKNHTSPLCSVKTLNYFESIIALEEARTYGADDILWQNFNNNFVDFSIGNLVIENHEGIFLSPPPTEGCLAGISLQTFEKPLIYTPITKQDLLQAKTIYRTNSLTGFIKIDKDFLYKQLQKI